MSSVYLPLCSFLLSYNQQAALWINNSYLNARFRLHYLSSALLLYACPVPWPDDAYVTESASLISLYSRIEVLFLKSRQNPSILDLLLQLRNLLEMYSYTQTHTHIQDNLTWCWIEVAANEMDWYHQRQKFEARDVNDIMFHFELHIISYFCALLMTHIISVNTIHWITICFMKKLML